MTVLVPVKIQKGDLVGCSQKEHMLRVAPRLSSQKKKLINYFSEYHIIN